MSYHLPGDVPDDPDNPYSAPLPIRELAPARLRGMVSPQLEIGEIFSVTWNIYKDQLGLCVGVSLVAGILPYIVQVALQALWLVIQLGGADTVVLMVGALIAGTIGYLIFLLWIYAGLFLFFMNVAAGRNPRFADLFSGGRFLLPYLGSTFILIIVGGTLQIIALTIPIVLVYLVSQGDQTALIAGVGLGTLAALVVMVILLTRLSQYPFLIFDRKAGPIDSLSMSVEITRGKSFQILGLLLLAIPINILGTLACCVGVLFTVPFTYLMWAVTYFAITGQKVADPTAAYRYAGGPKPLAQDDLF